MSVVVAAALLVLVLFGLGGGGYQSDIQISFLLLQAEQVKRKGKWDAQH